MAKIPAVYNPSWYDAQKVGDWEVFFIPPEHPESFAKHNPIIVFGGTLDTENITERISEASRREREIFNSLEMGNLVCLIFRLDILTYRVLNRLNIQFGVWGMPRVDFHIRRSEFTSLLKKYGETKYEWQGDFDDIICETEDGKIVGFAKRVRKGTLLFLPCYISLDKLEHSDIIEDFLPALLDTLKKYLSKTHYQPPDWADSYRFPNERVTLSKLKKLEGEIVEVEKLLERYSKLKQILWFRDDELVEAVTSFFDKIGIKTKRDEIHEEDFWIVERNKETVVVEVKGLDKNLKRPHISKLDEHRGAREKPDDFPALLIVNSFNKAKSLREKDKDISANEIKKAVRTNVLVVRTIDLYNAMFLMEKEKLTTSDFLRIIKTEKGWLKVTSSDYEIKKM